MKVLEIEQRSPEWMSFREGKITGTKLGKIFQKSRKDEELYDTTKPAQEFYQMVADRLAVGTADDGDGDGLTSTAQRGRDLEDEAISRAEQELGMKFVRGGVWQAGESHIHSPDAYTKNMKTGLEIKCVSSANHIKAIINDDPYKLGKEDYFGEYINYFLANPELDTLIVFLYDPRFILSKLQWHSWKIKREDMTYKVARMEDIKDEALQQVNEAVAKLIKEYGD
jgi:hypothetical protein